MFCLNPFLSLCQDSDVRHAVYALAHELYPGRFKPTITHCFLKLLVQHSLPHTCFTQNIDSLERSAGVPEEILVEAHGSFSDQHCIECSLGYDAIKMKHKVFAKDPPKCEACGGLVKPDIVFFGEPVRFTSVPLASPINLCSMIDCLYRLLVALLKRNTTQTRQTSL
jgi:NAD-dependent SIR2 family protein deacetylase